MSGIDAHVADLETAPKKKRKKPAPLTAKTLAELRKRGWTAQVVERWMPHTHVKVDLFGVIDIVAIRPRLSGARGPQIVGIQVTGSRASGGIIAAHRTKILAEPRADEWVDAGGALELWGWRMVRNRWVLTVETYADMVESAR